MRLRYDDPDRPPSLHPQDGFVINDRTDGGDPIVRAGETFEVTDRRARELLARYYPQLKPAES